MQVPQPTSPPPIAVPTAVGPADGTDLATAFPAPPTAFPSLPQFSSRFPGDSFAGSTSEGVCRDGVLAADDRAALARSGRDRDRTLTLLLDPNFDRE